MWRSTVLLFVAVSLPAQVARDRPPATFAALLRNLRESAPKARVGVLQTFLRGREATELPTLRARLLLALSLLRGFDLRRAQAAFQKVLDDAEAKHRSLLARSLYGLAQCEELLDRPSRARASLRRLVTDYRDLPYARFGEAALQRLRSPRAVAVGKPAPVFAPVRDLTGRSQSLASRRGKPVLLLFVAPSDADSAAYAARLLRAWHAGSSAPTDVILFAVQDTSANLRDLVKKRQWKMPVVHCNGAFLDPVLLAFGVQALPHGFLVGPDGTLLLVSPTPRKLEAALAVLKK